MPSALLDAEDFLLLFAAVFTEPPLDSTYPPPFFLSFLATPL